MAKKQDSPGVYIPPPLFYILIFIAAALIQRKIRLNDTLYKSNVTKIVGIVFFAGALFFFSHKFKAVFQEQKHFNTY